MRRRAGLLTVVTVALAVGACADDDASGDDATDSSSDLVADFGYEADHEELGPTDCPLKSIRFTDESEGDPETWSWAFGDGSTSTEQDPLVTTRIGRATLTVTRGAETDSITKDVQIVDC